jgi:cell division protein FtsB
MTARAVTGVARARSATTPRTSARHAASARPASRTARVRVSTRAAVLLIVVLAVLTFAIAPVRALLGQRAELDRLERQSQELQRQNEALNDRILQLQDPAYLERLARECLGMVEPGETAFVTVPEEGPPPTSADC